MDDPIDRQVLEVLSNLIDGRNNFFSEGFIRALNFESRSALVSRFMVNELVYAEIINRIYMNTIQTRSAAVALINLTVPQTTTTTFFEPVHVTASQAQINSALVDAPNASGTCAICQDAISSGACRIRQCGHLYHRSCILNWLSMSVRCPVCRHDIRDEVTHLANQTSLASSQNSSQQTGQ
jgi:hypothetical protein